MENRDKKITAENENEKLAQLLENHRIASETHKYVVIDYTHNTREIFYSLRDAYRYAYNLLDDSPKSQIYIKESRTNIFRIPVGIRVTKE